MMTLNGNSPSFNGVTLVNGGTLSLNGSQPFSPVTVNAGATLMGNGVAGVVSVAGGTASPGNSTGLLKTARLLLSANSLFKAELNGPLAGVSYDQVDVAGGVDVGTATLDVALSFSPPPGSQFALILNDGADVITNTFKDLPEGATLSIGGAQFQISYKGGDGNDIMLTQLSSSAPHIGGITPSGNGGIQLKGTGAAGVTYNVEANTNLSRTNWVKIGSGLADVNGQVSFVDTNAASFQRRFYRFKSP